MKNQIALSLSAFISFATPIPLCVAAETIVAEEFCALDGYTRPLRQTIVVIDQLAVDPWTSGDMTEGNRRWINAIVGLAGIQDGQRSVISAPRERLTILLAKSTGSDLLRVFSGCPPTFSREEMDKMSSGGGGMGRKFEEWLGKDPKSRVEADQKAFRTKLLGALVQVTKDSTVKKSAASDFLTLIPEVGRSFDVANGIPRIILFSPLKLSNTQFDRRQTAREAGFRQASRTAADLKRAEVYVVRGANDASPLVRDYVATFLLGSKGFLVDWSGETMPALRDPPQAIAVYGGHIAYGQVKAPMQIRLAVDATGTLVNSWVEVTVDKSVATPMSGKAICKQSTLDDCTITGDGKDFSQAWAIDPDPNKPTFDPQLPFSGIRWFEITSVAKGVSGRFMDPMVIVNKQKELPFELSTTAHVKF